MNPGLRPGLTDTAFQAEINTGEGATSKPASEEPRIELRAVTRTFGANPTRQRGAARIELLAQAARRSVFLKS
jgi:hypothetical protein